MPERIDFALEPGVVLFTVLFVILLVVLIGSVAYPYFTSDPAEEPSPEEAGDFINDTTTDPKVLEQRMDEFVEEMEGERP